MNYPPPPWTLEGYGFLNLHWLDIERARSLIPSEFQVISVYPGKTVGGVFITSYKPGSVMPYNELIVVSGCVLYQGKPGAWISHIYVDNSDSVAGGRAIWGLPKELAQFEWSFAEQPQVKVSQGDRTLCSLTCHWRSPGLPLPPIEAPVFSTLNAVPLLFKASGSFNLQWINASLHVPDESPFASLKLGQGWLSFYSDRFSLEAGIPSKM